MTGTDDESQPISYAVALAAANQLKATIEASSVVHHPGEVGRARENILRQFLTSFCPKGLEFATGFVFDAHGKMSRQQDIVIYRTSYHPIFDIGGIQHFPIESVAAVVEVKSTLSSRASLNDALDCVSSVKTLDRTGKGKNYVVAGGIKAVFDPKLHEHQVFTAIAMMSGMTSPTAVNTVAEWCRSHDRAEWPNWLVSAFDYTIYYDTPGDLPRCNSMLAQGLVSSVIGDTRNTIPILDFLGELISFLRVTPLVDFRPNNYFPDSLHYENYQPL